MVLRLSRWSCEKRRVLLARSSGVYIDLHVDTVTVSRCIWNVYIYKETSDNVHPQWIKLWVVHCIGSNHKQFATRVTWKLFSFASMSTNDAPSGKVVLTKWEIAYKMDRAKLDDIKGLNGRRPRRSKRNPEFQKPIHQKISRSRQATQR